MSPMKCVWPMTYVLRLRHGGRGQDGAVGKRGSELFFLLLFLPLIL